MTILHSIWRFLVPPLIVGVLFLGTWEIIVHVFDIQPYLLPAPSSIATTLGDNWSKVWDAMAVTGANALVGLVFGVVSGVALSFVLMRFNVVNELVTPLAVALNAIPMRTVPVVVSAAAVVVAPALATATAVMGLKRMDLVGTA